MKERSPEPRSKDDDLCIVFECSPWVCGVPTAWVKRLLSVDEARLLAVTPRGLERQDPRAAIEGGMLLEVGRRRFAAWDFGRLVELGALSSGWLLMMIPHGQRSVALALRVGPCIAVEVFAAGVALPQGLFRARREAFEQAFAFQPKAQPGARPSVGLRMNPAALWTRDELDLSARLIESSSPAPGPEPS